MKFPGTHNMYFIAIVCPTGLDKKVLQFKFWINEHFSSVAALKSPAHITLIQPFWLEENKEKKLQDTLQAFLSDTDELEIQLQGFSHFGKKVLFVRVLENPSLEELKNQTEIHFVSSFGGFINKDDRPFHPHITIAGRNLKPGDFEKAWQFFSKKIFKEKFPAGTISLLKLTEGKWKVIGEKRW
jgi:2'-5' RNA ligase